jgi:hypothetical protein
VTPYPTEVLFAEFSNAKRARAQPAHVTRLKHATRGNT